MGKILENIYVTLLIGVALAVLLMLEPSYALAPGASDRWLGLFQWLHVFFGITWIGLLYYFNFVQIPTMPAIPAELKPGVSKYIAPSALFYFRWGAVFTVLTGLILAWLYDELVPALTLQENSRLIGIGMWLALIMAANVWAIIWPNQQTRIGAGRGRRRGKGEVGAHGDASIAGERRPVDPDAARDDQRALMRGGVPALPAVRA